MTNQLHDWNELLASAMTVEEVREQAFLEAEPDPEIRELLRQNVGHKTVPVPVLDIVPASESSQWGMSADLIDNTKTPLNSDMVLAEMVETALHDWLIWSAGRGWLYWDDKRWCAMSDVAALEMVRKQLRIFVMQVVESEKNNEFHAKQMLPLLSYTKADKVYRFLKGMMEVPSDAFDAHPWLINTPDGVIDLRTSEVSPHDRGLLLTRMARASLNPYGDTHPDWDAALDALPVDVATYMQHRIGQAATGFMTPDAQVEFLLGGGSNGKSTFFTGIFEALGDYAAIIPEKVLLADPNAHTTEMTTLQGVRLGLIEELPEGRHLNTKRLKDLAGTPQMTARKMRQDSITWKSTHSLFVTTNNLPKVNETDTGVWRRLELVRFPYRYRKPYEAIEGPNDRRGDGGILTRLQDNETHQLDAVLAWIVEGAKWFYRDGLPQVPDEIVEDMALWRGSSDLVAAYLAERIEWDSTSKVVSSELFADFTDWLNESGHANWNDQTFASRFDQHEEVTKHNVTKSRTTSQNGLSRPVVAMFAPLPTKLTVWTGMRFA